MKTCRCRREEAGLCSWGHGQTGKRVRVFASPQPLPPAISSMATHRRFAGEFCWDAISMLLLGLVPVSGEQPALPSPTAADSRAELSAKLHMGSSPGREEVRPWGRWQEFEGHKRTRICLCKCNRGPLHIPECSQSHAVPAQWGCGTTCGAAGLQQWDIDRAMKQLPGGDRKDRLQRGILHVLPLF